MLQQALAVPAQEEAAVLTVPATPAADEEARLPGLRVVAARIMGATPTPGKFSQFVRHFSPLCLRCPPQLEQPVHTRREDI